MGDISCEIQELCAVAGVTKPERFIDLGIRTTADLDQIDIVQEMAFLEQRGITYMDVRKLKNAAESVEVSKGPQTVALASKQMEMILPPAQYAEKFASLARGCYCWRIVDHLKGEKTKTVQESALIITAEFLLVCTLEGSITSAVRCQDIEIAALQQASPPLIAFKAYDTCCEPTVLLSMKPNLTNPVNDTMHPLHALNFTRKPKTNTDLALIRVPLAVSMYTLPQLAKTFNEGEGFLPPHVKFQILQKTKQWPQGSSVPTMEFEYKASDGTLNIIRLGKNFGAAGKLQWLVDGKTRIQDIREVRYDNGVLKLRKGDVVAAPTLPADPVAREQCIQSIGTLAARARVRCNGIQVAKKKPSKMTDDLDASPVSESTQKKAPSSQPALRFTDDNGVKHRIADQPAESSLEWWVGGSHCFVAKNLTYDGAVIAAGCGASAKTTDKNIVSKIHALAQACRVPCVGFDEGGRNSAVSNASTSSYRHDPYHMIDTDSDIDAQSPKANGLNLNMTFAGGPSQKQPPRTSSPLEEVLPRQFGMSFADDNGLHGDGPPAYGVRRFSPALLSNSATHGQGGSPQQGKTSPFYSHHTPSPPPLCTPNPTPPVPTPPPGGSYANTSPSSYPQPLAPIPATPTTPTAGYQSAYQQPYQPAQSPMTLVQPAEQQARGLTSPTALGTGAKCVAAVSMKYGRKGEFVSTANHSLGECVVVETPKGIALGTVTAVRAYSENDARNGKVMRVATPQEFQLWAGLGNHEQIAMQRLVELAALCGLSQTLLLHQCEYPYDSTSLLVHCSKASRDVNLTYYLEQAARLLQCAVSVNECDAFITQAVRLVPPSIT